MTFLGPATRARLASLWLALRYPLLRRRYNKLVLESVLDVPLLILPQVFNPVILVSGEFLARTLTEQSLIPQPAAATTVLDLGTGSGVGAVFAARQGATVMAVDINPAAVRCARLNALLNRLEEQIAVYQGDLFQPVIGHQFDVILFNPPYYRGRPADALDHAWRGEDVFERFAAGLPAMLKPDGQAYLVLSTIGQCDELLALLRADGFTITAVAQKPLLREILTIYRVRKC